MERRIIGEKGLRKAPYGVAVGLFGVVLGKKGAGYGVRGSKAESQWSPIFGYQRDDRIKHSQHEGKTRTTPDDR